jgi:membrane protein DedA with SNARE-associated domain
MTLESLITDWGLPALFAGGFFEGDTVAMLGGAVAHRGHLGFWSAAGAVSAGAAAADQMWFHLARARRHSALVTRIAARPAAQRLFGLIARRPVPAILGFRFVWGMRTIGPVVLGLSAVPRGLYVPLNLLAVAIWGLMMTAAGYGLGQAITRLAGHLPLHRHLALALGLAVLIVALAALLRLRHKPH